jgi:DNA-binding NarL/FixJ family response regulator
MPDVLVMDPALPDASGFDTCRQLREQIPGMQVVMLVARAEERIVMAVVRAGATGIACKRASLAETYDVVGAAAPASRGWTARPPPRSSIMYGVMTRGRRAARP